MKKFIKSLTVVVSIAVLSLGFAGCSSGDDGGSNGSDTALPNSVGVNELAGNNYKQSTHKYERVLSFSDDTMIEKYDDDEEILEYKYTYNSEKGIVYLKLVSLTIKDFGTYNSMNDFLKEYFGADDIFAEIKCFNYYIAANEKLIFTNWFDGVVSNMKFLYKNNDLTVEFNTGDARKHYLTAGNDYQITIDDNQKSVTGTNIKGSWTESVKGSKTIKEIYASNPSYDGALTEDNGYVVITFSELPDGCTLSTGKPYKFIADIDFDEFEKQ